MAVKAQFIAGQWLPGSGATMSKLAPEDQSLLWQAASAGADDVERPAPRRAAFYPGRTGRWPSVLTSYSVLPRCWRRIKRRWRP